MYLPTTAFTCIESCLFTLFCEEVLRLAPAHIISTLFNLKVIKEKRTPCSEAYENKELLWKKKKNSFFVVYLGFHKLGTGFQNFSFLNHELQCVNSHFGSFCVKNVIRKKQQPLLFAITRIKSIRSCRLNIHFKNKF